MSISSPDLPVITPAARLLAWYDAQGRADLPWRSHAGRAETAYHTWIAEIMLQQTTVAAVIPYYHRFLARWPTVTALAAAPLDDVLAAWAGLGYYARARNLHKCAQMVTAHHDGVFPPDISALLALPGIGDYTANAIAAIAYDGAAVVVDGNIERVMSRLFCIDEPVNRPAGKRAVRTRTASLWPVARSGDFAQGLMDLGATVCIPQHPRCLLCPLQADCCAFKNGRTHELPVKLKAKTNATRYGTMFVLRDAHDRLLLQQRPVTGLLGGLWEAPSTPWLPDRQQPTESFRPQAANTAWRILPGTVRHVFTHFPLELTIQVAQTDLDAPLLDACGQFPDASTQWFAADRLPALPTLMQKVLRHADDAA